MLLLVKKKNKTFTSQYKRIYRLKFDLNISPFQNAPIPAFNEKVPDYSKWVSLSSLLCENNGETSIIIVTPLFLQYHSRRVAFNINAKKASKFLLKTASGQTYVRGTFPVDTAPLSSSPSPKQQ